MSDARPAIEHELKTWPDYFEQVAIGAKPFELRRADRDYRVGDTLRLHEWDPALQRYTGREVVRVVTYTTSAFMEKGYIALGLGAGVAAGAARPPQPESAKEADTRVVGVPEGAHGDLPRPAPQHVRAPFENDETYQNVELWDRELRAAGWLPVSARTGQEVRGSQTWRSPHGGLYRGPYAAWKIMRDPESDR